MKNETTERERERGRSLFRYPFKNWVVKLLEVGFLRRRERRSFARERETGFRRKL